MVENKMNSSFLTKHLAKLSLIINLALTVMFWLWCIGTSDPLLFDLIRNYAFISVDAIKVVVTILCAIWIIRSITAYEAKVIQFVQADLLKEILNELQSSRELKRANDKENMKDDINIDFNRINID